MGIYKRGDTYWYEFVFNGVRHRESTHQGNANLARTMEGARRTQLAKGEVGLIDKEPAPTLTEFEPRFTQAVKLDCKPATITYYADGMKRLLDFPALAGARLDAINEEMIGDFKRHLECKISRFGRALSPSTVNGALRTLRRLLKLALEWEVIDRARGVQLVGGETNRDFVLGPKQEKTYLGAAPQLLADVATLMLDTACRPGEACALEWKHVHLDPANGARFGRIHIAEGKTKNAVRDLPLTGRATAMLTTRKRAARGSRYVFPGEDGGPGLVSSLDHQHAAVRTLLKLSGIFVVHSLRHTALTRLGEAGADAFTIMKIAGHSSITVSQRYVHPSPELVESAFEKLDAMNRSRRGESAGVPTKVPQGAKKPRAKNVAKLLSSNAMGA